jgi:predicted ATPase
MEEKDGHSQCLYVTAMQLKASEARHLTSSPKKVTLKASGGVGKTRSQWIVEESIWSAHHSEFSAYLRKALAP